MTECERQLLIIRLEAEHRKMVREMLLAGYPVNIYGKQAGSAR